MNLFSTHPSLFCGSIGIVTILLLSPFLLATEKALSIGRESVHNDQYQLMHRLMYQDICQGSCLFLLFNVTTLIIVLMLIILLVLSMCYCTSKRGEMFLVTKK